MKAEQLSDALNGLDDGIIEETGQLRETRKRRGGNWKRWATAAACLCVVVTALAALPRLVRNGPDPALTAPVHSGPASTPTEPVHIDPGLLPLQLPETVGGGYGFAGIMLYDISELGLGPWNQAMELTQLPVYKNGSYNIAGVPVGLGEYEILERLEAAARALDAEILDTEYYYGETATGTGPVACITARANGLEIAAQADGEVEVTFEGGLPLPEEYHFTDDATDEETEAVLNYLTGRFSDLLGFSQPRLALSGDYTFSGTLHRTNAVYDGGADSVEAILNYSFRSARFISNDDGNLRMIRLEDDLASARELGGYPIITADEAKSLLLDGRYITSVPYELSGEEYVAAVELTYRNSKTDEYFLPYYLFYVELPGEARDNGLKTYGMYYVPAVWEQYIANMPVYDGRFN